MTTKTKSASASLNELERRYAEAAERQRQQPARDCLEVLDAHARETTGAPGIAAAIDGEVRGYAACEDAVRAASEAALRDFPEPQATTPRIVAAEVRALRSMAQGALNALDHNPALLARWKTKITEIPDTAPRALAEAYWALLWPLLGQARALLATPAALAAQEQFIAGLVADPTAHGAPVEVARGSGPLPESLETPQVRGSYKAKTELSHD
jgi:hypothetical protein